jgi:hypothetical protein
MPKKTVKKAVRTAPLKAPAESWYWVCALYCSERRKSKKNPAPASHLWERRVFVFRAKRGQERRDAHALAKQHEHKFKNAEGDMVYWRFKGIESYAELFDKRIVSGTEVYWTFFRRRANTRV